MKKRQFLDKKDEKNIILLSPPTDFFSRQLHFLDPAIFGTIFARKSHFSLVHYFDFCPIPL